MALQANLLFANKLEKAGVRSSDRIAVAVSGGPDSMALCLLAFQWKRSGEGLVGMTVDHGLRAESPAEALQVQQWVRDIGMECELLTCHWPKGVPQKGHVQESARKARYTLLENACRKRNINVLLTAHHSDDQAELLVLRLSRSSGATGLAGMALASELFASTPSLPHKFLLVRPLLGFFKSELYEICRSAGQEWIEDPTNRKMIYARNKIRNALHAVPETSKSEIQCLISAYRKQRSELDKIRDRLLNQFTSLNQDCGYVTIDVEGLLSETKDEAILNRVIVAVLQFIAQKGTPPRGRVIQALVNWLQDRPIQTARSGGRCCLSPLPGSKGSKVLVTFSPDVHTRPNSGRTCLARNTATRDLQSDKHLVEAKALGIISEATAEFLASLSREMAEDMFLGNADKADGDSVQEEQILLPGKELYFMNRFLLSWQQGTEDKGQACCSACCLKVRHFNDKDLVELRKRGLSKNSEASCYGQEKLDEALKLLNPLQKHVRRALIAVTTVEDKLVAVPGVGLQLCSNSLIIARFCPRVPLGGGQCCYDY